MRTTFAILVSLLAASAAAAATVTFVTPQQGSQTIGPQLIEIATDALAVDRVEFLVDGKLVGVARTAPYRIAYDFGTSLDAREITAKVYSANFRNTDTARIRTAAMSAADVFDVDLVEVPLRARAKRKVTPADLRIRENGVEQTVRDVLPQRGAAHFVFVVDRSLSMGDGRLEEALAAIDSERSLLRPDDRMSIVTFNHHVSQLRPVARNESVAALMQNLAPSGGTSLRDALASAPSRERTYAVVITDGGDRNSELGEEAALRKISGTRTIVNAIVLGRTGKFLETAASNTGGEVVRAGRGEIRRRLHDLIADINSRYLVVYQSQGTKKGWRAIDVRSKSGSVSIVTARKGYFSG